MLRGGQEVKDCTCGGRLVAESFARYQCPCCGKTYLAEEVEIPGMTRSQGYGRMTEHLKSLRFISPQDLRFTSGL